MTVTADPMNVTGSRTDPGVDGPAGRRRRGLAERAASFLERRIDRRGVLRRGAMAGTALAVAPATFALRPGSAYAAVCDRNALCYDGYTEFCCTITGANRCPSGTALGGWWKVDGSSFCGGGPRYYMDCNATCGSCGCGANGICAGSCSGTPCGCANGDCNNRKAGCTGFRYGQCNQGVRCLGPIVCRVVTCTEPWRLDGSCTTAARTDNATRYHTRPCLDVDAIGSLEAVTAVPGGVRVSGWALDPGAPGVSITVNVYDCLRPVGSFNAGYPRADVAQNYPGQGAAHGFDAFFRFCPGERLVSVAAVDTSGRGSNWIGHRMVTIDPNPVGHFDQAIGGVEQIRVTGFVIDPDVPDGPVEVLVDGAVAASVGSNLYRPDIQQAYPHLGGNFGFDATFPASPGNHNVCVVRRVPGGRDIDLGCRPVAVAANPRGVVESATSPGPGSVRVVGWALDPDTAGPIEVAVWVDGTIVNRTTAGGSRPAPYGGHGYDITLTGVAPGSRQVCVTAANVGPGVDALLGCAQLGVASVSAGQVMALEAVDDGVRIATTEIPRSDGAAANVRVLVDGGFRASLKAGPGGIDEVLTLPPGEHEVVVTATVDGPRTIPPVLASASITVPGGEATSASPTTVVPTTVGADAATTDPSAGGGS